MAKEVPETKSPITPAGNRNGGTTVVTSRTETVRKGRSQLLIWVALTVLLGAGIFLVWHHFAGAASTDATATASGTTGRGKRGAGGDMIRVVTAVATSGDIAVYLKGLGSVTPRNTVTVRSRVDGQLMKVLFQEGQNVKKDELLAQIDDRPFKAQVAQFTAQKEHDQALLDNAKLDLTRYQTLWKLDSIPQQQLATQEALVKQDQGTVDSDQAQIDTAQLNVTYCAITAPLSGRVGLRLVDEGNQVHASDANGLLVITEVQPITVIFTIPEDSVQVVLDKLRTSQTLKVDAFDRDNKNNLESDGTLLTTDNQIDPTTGTLRLKAVFPNTKNELFPNQFVNARLLVDTKKGVTLIPVSAIQYGTQGTFVYVVDMTDTGAKTKTVKLRNIEVGTTDGDLGVAEITNGVAPGETVVTDGVDKLQDGSKVLLAQPDDGSGGGSDSTGGTHSGHKHGTDASANAGGA